MITVHLDSAGGQQCLLFYRDGKAFYTHWFPLGVWFNHFSLPPGAADDLAKLFDTMRAFDMPQEQRHAAVAELFKKYGLT